MPFSALNSSPSKPAIYVARHVSHAVSSPERRHADPKICTSVTTSQVGSCLRVGKTMNGGQISWKKRSAIWTGRLLLREKCSGRRSNLSGILEDLAAFPIPEKFSTRGFANTRVCRQEVTRAPSSTLARTGDSDRPRSDPVPTLDWFRCSV